MSGPAPPIPPERPAHRVAVIGDVAGHLDELRAELRRLGVDEATGQLPGDLTVVQVGDLVHRGLESDQVVALVDRYLTEQPGRWIQLVGNHEAHYLYDPVFEWPQRISAESGDTLRRWWADGQMQVATWVREHDEGFLITHAGLTAQFWRATLDVPTSAERAAATLNSLIGARDRALFRAGTMLNRGWRAGGVGPVWAASGTELLPGWLDTTLPFSQIHGHDSPYDWQRQRFRTADKIARLTVLDHEAKHAVTTLPGGRIIAVDPGHSSQARTPWRAWELRTSSDQALPGVGGLGIR